MLERLVRNVILLTAMSLACSTVAAGVPVEETMDEAQRQAESAPESVPDAEDLMPTDEDPYVPSPKPRIPSTPDEVPSEAEQARAMAHAAHDKATRVAERLRTEVETLVGDLVPSDPLTFVQDKLEPVRQTADSVQATIFAEERPEESPMVGTATATELPFTQQQALLVASATAAAAVLAILWLAGSSGSVGAGAASAAGSGGKLATTDLKRLLPYASPLFTRFEKDTVLGHPKREALYGLILQSPGVSLQSLCDATGLSRTAVTHHLRLMELQHLIVSKRMGRSRHYFENGGRFGRDQKEALAILQNGRSKDVATFVKEHPGAIQKVLCEALGLQPSIAHWHLTRLQQAQLVESVRSGRTVSYFPGVALRSTDQPVVPASVLAAPTAA